MRLNMTKRHTVIMLCALAMATTVPAIPAFANGNIPVKGQAIAKGTAYGARSQSSDESKMRDAAAHVQEAFDKQDLNKLAGLCTYPLTVSYKNGDLVEVKNKQGFLALGSEIIFSRAMRNAVASTNVAKLVSVGKAGAQIGDDCGLSLYKVGGKWKAGYFYLDAAGSSDQQAVDISSLSEMAEQIQKTFSYKSLDTLAMMCNYPMVMTYANGTSQEIQTPDQLKALGEDKVFTDKLSKAIDKAEVSKLKEVGNAGVQMGGDSGLNMYRFNGYWKINQIYQ